MNRFRWLITLTAPLLIIGRAYAMNEEFSAIEQQVLAVEDAYVAAEIAHDEAKLRELIDDHFVQNLSNGSTQGKAEFIASVMKLPMVGQTVRERTVRVENGIALVFGTADIRFAPPGKDEFTASLRYTATYVKRDDQWRMLALQMQARD